MEQHKPHIRNILLDRDGTVIQERNYLSDPGGVALVPGGGEALGRLTRAGARLFLVTNQSGIGRGYYSLADFQSVQERLLSLLTPYGASITDTAFCPHAPDDACPCRKPATGLFAALTAQYGLVAAETAVIGDAISDIAFGLALGSPLTILVHTGHGARMARELGLPEPQAEALVLDARQPGWPHVLAPDLSAAADFLMRGYIA
jgi:D-glycero-D-manno-heptose 1,7-bisphosphate phosphatase